ncbi:MAG: hypothetical protein JOZ49_01345 [Mycolicibacterium sp.]|nr:hypothetical protein [Mycolicibacterium sp.]
MMSAAAVGCSLAVPGAPVKAPGGSPPGAVDLNLLGSGNFPTAPAPPLGAAGSAPAGALIDARRMADNVVGPWEVDPSLVTPSPVRAIVLKDAGAVGLIEPNGVAAAAHAHNFINGFASDRQGPVELRLMNAVLRFADAPSAAAAAADMAQAETSQQPNRPEPVPIPGHPDTLATTYSYNAYGGDQRPIMVVSYTAHGPYVLCQTAQANQIDIAAGLIAKTLDLQGPLIDRFSPTDPMKFADLPADPAGLLAHTMPFPTYPEPSTSVPTNPNVGIYQPHGALHFQDDPPGAAAALTTAGVQAVSYNQTFVYQANDPAAAAQLAQDLANSMLQTQPSATPIGAVDFMPTSRCLQSDSPEAGGPAHYYCYAPAESFTIEVQAADATGARQETAAQYKMLLAK